MAEADLLVAGGTLVTGRGRRRAHVAVSRGRIVYVGHERPAADRTVDASGLYVLPGMVDTHVHLMDPGAPDREDFPTGSSAAAASGVTTILEHTHGHPVRKVADLVDKRSYLAGRSNVDFDLAAHAWPGHHDAVAPLWEAGAAFFKLFTCTTHGIPGHDPARLKAHLEASASVDAVTLMHCEDESITEHAERVLRDAGRDDGGVLPEWRSREAEVVAVAVAGLLVRLTGARAGLAHLSHPEAVAYAARERAAGARLAAEACPQYFLLREHEALDAGALRKFTPPARARSDADEAEMWQLLRGGVLTHMATDHAPSTRAHKADGDIWSVHFGLPGLDSTMALLLDAAARGRLALEDVVRAYSEHPAHHYGLAPRKGALRPGADGDLTLVDMGHSRVLRDGDVLSKAGWTPYAGREVRGGVVQTYLRGRLVAEEGTPLRELTGQFLPGAGAHGPRG
ncbi:MAG: dihydroorotase [Streptomycetales bacterium]